MMLPLLILLAAGSVHAKLENIELYSDEYIDYINSIQNSWTAGRNFPANTSYKFFLNRYGVHPDAMKERLPERPVLNSTIKLDEYFDARVYWPQCYTIGDIRNQNNCEGCWAFAPVEVISDRICINSERNENVLISAQELIECCTDCAPNSGCRPGFPVKAWKYWYKEGLVSGGDYNDTKTCLPFTCPDCPPNGTCPFCRPPECKQKCQSSYAGYFNEDKHYGKEIYSVPPNEKQIMKEVRMNGPVQTVFIVYCDFACYRRGVYRHYDKRICGRHAVKIIGWGVENFVPYWLISNSQGTNFGELGGFFKILRGSNECEIESHVHAGFPLEKY